MCPIVLVFRFRVRLERLRRFVKGHKKDYAPMFPIDFSERSSETLDKLVSLAKEDKGDEAPKVKIELRVQLSEILDRLWRLQIIFKRDLVSVSPILNFSRLRQTLERLSNLVGAYLKSANTL